MKSYKISRKKNNRQLLAKNLIASIVVYEKIVTTHAKAKMVQPKLERIISNVRKMDIVNATRYALAETGQKNAAKKLVEVLKNRFINDNGGYTRIVKIGNRKGDNAEIVIIELTKKTEVKKPEEKKTAESKQVKKVDASSKKITKK